MKYGFGTPPGGAGRYSARPGAKAAQVRHGRGRARLLLAPFVLLAAAALCVAMLLARAECMAVSAECGELAQELAALADERARLTIELEGLYPIAEVEEYARGELGMVPAAG